MKSSKRLLGERIKEIRKRCGLSQEKVAERLGIDAKSMSRIEVGGSYPSLETLDNLADILGVELKDFFEFTHLREDGTDNENICQMLNGISKKEKKTIIKVIKAIIK